MLLLLYLNIYQLSGTVLENVFCYHDLGVTFDKRLKFNNHVSNILNKLMEQTQWYD